MSTRVGPDLGTIDPALPALATAFDPEAAARTFEQAWGDPVTGCTLLTTRFEPGVRCVTTYALVLHDGGAGTGTIGVLETAPDAVMPRRFELDPALPGLASAVDPDGMAARLGWATCAVETVRYRPEERVVLRYRDPGTVVSYGKVLAGGTAALVAALAVLHEAGRADATLPMVPPPAVLAEDLDLVVVPEVRGPSLHDVVFGRSGDGPEAVRRTGRALAGLHAASIAADRVMSTGDDVQALRSYLPAAMCADPATGTRLATMVDRADAGPDGPTGPSHGALRTDQVILTGGRPALIDLDGFCAAHPARDLGNVLAYLRWRAVRRPGDRAVVSASRRALLEGYRRGGSAMDPGALRYFEAVALLKIAGRRYRRLAVDEFAFVPELLDAADALLEAAS